MRPIRAKDATTKGHRGTAIVSATGRECPTMKEPHHEGCDDQEGDDSGGILDRTRNALVTEAEGVTNRGRTAHQGTAPAKVRPEKGSSASLLRPAGKEM